MGPIDGGKELDASGMTGRKYIVRKIEADR